MTVKWVLSCLPLCIFFHIQDGGGDKCSSTPSPIPIPVPATPATAQAWDALGVDMGPKLKAEGAAISRTTTSDRTLIPVVVLLFGGG